VDVTTKVDELSREIDQHVVAGFALTIAFHTPIQHDACSFFSIHLYYAKDCPIV
jgi:hypothetical protein